VRLAWLVMGEPRDDVVGLAEFGRRRVGGIGRVDI
jgi:hypothetical protein